MVAENYEETMDMVTIIIVLVAIIVGLTIFLAGLLTALRLTRPRW